MMTRTIAIRRTAHAHSQRPSLSPAFNSFVQILTSLINSMQTAMSRSLAGLKANVATSGRVSLRPKGAPACAAAAQSSRASTCMIVCLRATALPRP